MLLSACPLAFIHTPDEQARPKCMCQAKMESFHQQPDRHSAPHIYHIRDFSEGGSTVQLDHSANLILPRKLEHRVH